MIDLSVKIELHSIHQQEFLQINADLAKKWPVITEKKDPPADAKEWEDVANKRQYLQET